MPHEVLAQRDERVGFQGANLAHRFPVGGRVRARLVSDFPHRIDVEVFDRAPRRDELLGGGCIPESCIRAQPDEHVFVGRQRGELLQEWQTLRTHCRNPAGHIVRGPKWQRRLEP